MFQLDIICEGRVDLIKIDEVMLMTRSTIGVLINQGGVILKNNLIRTDFELIQDFSQDDIICTFQYDSIKTERVMLMTKTYRGFFKQLRGRSSKINDPI